MGTKAEAGFAFIQERAEFADEELLDAAESAKPSSSRSSLAERLAHRRRPEPLDGITEVGAGGQGV